MQIKYEGMIISNLSSFLFLHCLEYFAMCMYYLILGEGAIFTLKETSV